MLGSQLWELGIDHGRDMCTKGPTPPPTPWLPAPSESLPTSTALLKLEHEDSSVALAVLRSQAFSVGVNL